MTDTVRALIERLKSEAADIDGYPAASAFRQAATELTTLLERCEKAEARAEELEHYEELWLGMGVK